MKAGSSLPVSQETACGVRFTLISPQMIFHCRTFPQSESMRRCCCGSLLQDSESHPACRNWNWNCLGPSRDPAVVLFSCGLVNCGQLTSDMHDPTRGKSKQAAVLHFPLISRRRVVFKRPTKRLGRFVAAVSTAPHVRCMTARPVKRPMNDS